MVPHDEITARDEICDVRIVHQERVQRARREAIDDRDIVRLAMMYKSLGDPTRLKIALALVDGEMCVCDLAAFIGVGESCVSHQLRQLRNLALVKTRREKQVVYYSLDDDHVNQLLNVGLEHLHPPS